MVYGAMLRLLREFFLELMASVSETQRDIQADSQMTGQRRIRTTDLKRIGQNLPVEACLRFAAIIPT